MVTTIVVPDGCVRHDDMRLAGLIALQLPLRPGIAHDHRVPRGMASRAGRQSAQGRRSPVPAACVPFHGRQHAPMAQRRAVYAEKAVQDASKAALIFNCTQRAHQNTLENLPLAILMYARSRRTAATCETDPLA
jgi:hypothetical protein